MTLWRKIMEHKFGIANWRDYIPTPVCEAHPEYLEFYHKAWELAFAHIKDIPGMPQNPYMDEALCATQVWIWDSCFMSLYCKYAREVFPGVETLHNFYEVLYGDKRLPVIMPPEDEPDWTGAVYGTPFEIKVHIADNPPLFAWAEYENALMRGDKDYIKTLLYEQKFLQKHYDWIENLSEHYLPDGVNCETCLIREEKGYRWEGGRSGMDNTPRGRLGKTEPHDRPNNPDMLWVDAICQQALSARMIARLYMTVGDSRTASEWEAKYNEKKALINELYWDEDDRFYYDINVNTSDFYKVMTMGSYWALTAGVASKERAKAMAERIEDPETLGGEVPFKTHAKNDADYDPTGKYWRGAVWLPTAYAALKGFAEYGYFEKAHAAAEKLLWHMYCTYKEYSPHTIWECYSPTEHKPATNTDALTTVKKDFCGWSALGPISVYIEFVLGFHSIDAFARVVKWEKPRDLKGEIGIQGLRFGDTVTDIVANGDIVCVTSNKEYTLEINGRSYPIPCGEVRISL